MKAVGPAQDLWALSKNHGAPCVNFEPNGLAHSAVNLDVITVQGAPGTRARSGEAGIAEGRQDPARLTSRSIAVLRNGVHVPASQQRRPHHSWRGRCGGQMAV